MFQKGSNFLSLLQINPDDIKKMINTSIKLKKRIMKPPSSLINKTIALIFQKPSTRTRVSLEVAIHRLKGSPLYLNWNDLQLGRGEPISDTIQVLDRYVDGIIARLYSHSDLIEMAKYANTPIINALSDLCHPLQILADLQTILEKHGAFKGVKLAYIGDGNNICNSLMIGCVKMGIDISIATPKSYQPDKHFIEISLKEAQKNKVKIDLMDNPSKAVENADIVYTDVIISMGQEAEEHKKLKMFLPKYRVTQKLMNLASSNAFFMHPLPCYRGKEVEEEVIDGPQSLVWDQAENRLYSTQALLSLIY